MKSTAACLGLLAVVALAAAAKVSSGDEAIAALTGNDARAQEEGRAFLRAMGVKAFPILQAALAKYPKSPQRPGLVRAIAVFEGPEPQNLIAKELKSFDPEILRAAAAAAGVMQAKMHLPLLLKLLAHKTRAVQAAALDALVEFRAEAEKPVRTAMADADPRLRGGALEAAAALLLPKIEQQLVLALADRDPQVQCGALRGLGRLQGEQYVDQIAAAVASPDMEVAVAAAEALSRIPSPKAEAVLTKLLTGAADESVKLVAIRTLAATNTAGPGILVDTLTVAGPQLREEIRAIIAKRCDPGTIQTLSDIMAEANPYRAKAAGDLLLACGGAGEEALFTNLHATSNQTLSNNMKGFFVALGERMVAPLNAELKNPDPEYRVLVIDILGAIGSPTSIEPLAELIRSADVRVRRGVARALAGYQQAESLAKLKHLAADADPEIRKTVLEAAVQRGGEEAVDVLVKGLQDPDRSTRLAVIAGLGQTHSPRAVKPLADLLPVTEGYERRYVVEALGKLRCPEAAGVLLELVTDPDPKVSQIAQEALK